MLLEQNGLTPVSSPAEILETPERSVIVLMGNLNQVMPPRIIERFCLRGGRVLMACDTGYSAGMITEFHAGPVVARNSRDHYQGFDDCLKITNLDQTHPLMQGVGSLVVNRSGWLGKHRGGLDWDVLARIPSQCSPSQSSTEPLMAEVAIYPQAVGKLVIAADQSLFTNGMLWHGDNAILAINLSQMLCEGNRTRLLFVTDGTPLASYQQSPAMNQLPDLPENLPEPTMASMFQIANSVVKNVQESNVANEMLANQPRNMKASHVRRALLFALAIASLLFVMWLLTCTGPSTHPPMPERTMKTAHALAADQKVKSTEFGQAASLLARSLCRELTGSQDSAEWLRQLGGNAVSGASPVGEKTKEKPLSIVLDLAVNPRTVHISRKRFEFIGRTVQELRQLHRQDGLLAGAK